MSEDRETFGEFIARNPQYLPQEGELMSNVHRRQHEAFVAYVDEQVQKVLEEIKSRFSVENHSAK
jgi:hypothetical protein